jgi:bifunctional DNA-binding transcriptional regulator/antitoxin component of YhaV-PrlF toxin-antitoxin module
MVTRNFKLTSKRQITVPQAVLKQLGVGPGDSVCFEIQDNKGILIKAGHQEHLSALDLHKKFTAHVTCSASLDTINDAIARGYADRAGG